MGILEDVQWGNQALKLISMSETLLPTPAMLFLRHSERFEPEEFEEIQKAKLTERGIECAFEFGKRLPTERSYRLFHSPLERCAQTAESIQKGIIDNDGDARIISPIQELYIPTLDCEKIKELSHGNERNMVFKWLAGHFSDEVIEPSLKYSQKVFEITHTFHKSAKDNSVDIFVSHDLNSMTFRFHWCGIIPDTHNWINTLGGFFLQIEKENEKLTYYDYEFGKNTIHLPIWMK